MKHHTPFALAALATTVAAVFGPARPVRAEHPASLTVTLDEATVMGGQPLIATVTITNNGRVPLVGSAFVGGGFGQNVAQDPSNADWLRLELRDETGVVVRRDTRRRSNEMEPPHPISGIISSNSDQNYYVGTLAPERSVSFRLLLTPWVAPTKPGHYTLVARATLPTGGDLREVTTSTAPLPDVAVPLTVIPADRARLKRIAADLLTRIHGPDTGVESISLDALFSMPASAVRSVWREIALDPKYAHAFVIPAHLVKSGGVEAAWILGEMYAAAPEEETDDCPGVDRAHLKEMLRQLRARSTDPAARAQVDRLIGPEDPR
jgi:hypothetical protein